MSCIYHCLINEMNANNKHNNRYISVSSNFCSQFILPCPLHSTNNLNQYEVINFPFNPRENRKLAKDTKPKVLYFPIILWTHNIFHWTNPPTTVRWVLHLKKKKKKQDKHIPSEHECYFPWLWGEKRGNEWNSRPMSYKLNLTTPQQKFSFIQLKAVPFLDMSMLK